MASNKIESIQNIRFSKTREDATFPLKNIATKNNSKPKDIIYNLAKYLNVSDISNIKYTTGATNGHNLEPLNDLFSDNIILYYYLPQRIYENPKLIKYLKHVQEIDKQCKESKLDVKLEDIVKGCLPEHTAKIKDIFNTNGLDINKNVLNQHIYIVF